MNKCQLIVCLDQKYLLKKSDYVLWLKDIVPIANKHLNRDKSGSETMRPI